MTTAPDRPTCHWPPTGWRDERFEEFLAGLEPGTDLDASGCVIDALALTRVLETVSEFGNVNFDNAQFEHVGEIRAMSAKRLSLDGARFDRWVRIDVVAEYVSCVGTVFDGGVLLQAHSAVVDLTEATFGATSVVATTDRFAPWPKGHKWDPGWAETFAGTSLKLLSLRRTDVSKLTLVNVDLSWCLFAGTHRLDQLRFEGRCRFNTERARWWWTRRQMLAEEYLSRTRDEHPYFHHQVRNGPVRLAGLYRALRKAFEDSKNEPGAGDFYYGEMEMRRHSPATPRAERWILAAYWLLSGYGQRAARALAALVAVIATVSVLLFTIGLPGEVVWTGSRVEQSIRIAMGAVVLRDAGQQLTSAGSWTVMVARILGPVLLALAVLAIRARVKR